MLYVVFPVVVLYPVVVVWWSDAGGKDPVGSRLIAYALELTPTASKSKNAGMVTKNDGRSESKATKI